VYRRVDNALVARIVVNVDCDAAQGRDFGGEFVETGVVLSACELAVACYIVGYRLGAAWGCSRCGNRRTVRVRRTGT
jgi:hypothetical protein